MFSRTKKVLKGHRNHQDGLWDIPIPIPLQHRANPIIIKDNTKTELIQYLHGYCFIPTPRKFICAVKMEIPNVAGPQYIQTILFLSIFHINSPCPYGPIDKKPAINHYITYLWQGRAQGHYPKNRYPQHKIIWCLRPNHSIHNEVNMIQQSYWCLNLHINLSEQVYHNSLRLWFQRHTWWAPKKLPISNHLGWFFKTSFYLTKTGPGTKYVHNGKHMIIWYEGSPYET